MKVEEIERLLAKFYEGNTDEQEEQRLNEAFNTEEVPAHLQRDKRLFIGFSRQDADVVPVGLADRLSRMIDEKAKEEQHFFHPNKTKRNWRWVGGAAATVLLLFGMGYSIASWEGHSSTPQDTFSNPEDAYKALEATLMEVSTNLNQGIQQVEEIRIEVRKVNQEIKNEIQK